MTEIIVAVIGALGGIFGAWYGSKQKIEADSNSEAARQARMQADDARSQAIEAKQRASIANHQWEGLTLPAQVPENMKRCSVMLIGLGGSGKTSLIRNLLPGVPANPLERTETYEMYKLEIKAGVVENHANVSQETEVVLYMGDYKGQDLGTLIRTYIKQQKQPFHPMAYGYTNALIVVVDLIPPPDNQGDPDPLPTNKPDDGRIRIHNREWNETSLDAVFGLLTNALRVVCLFINKYDLITDNTPEMQDKIRARYNPLVSRLRKRAEDSGAQIHVLLGSAKSGGEVGPLTDLLLANAVFDVGQKVDSVKDGPSIAAAEENVIDPVLDPA